ncbi:MAG: hypothetical protein IPM74_10540 [Crocinitomicaceae bacterium]|nr:hypothetical protein [Crocinitomicaceae bacterium]MBK8926326.1 hypothetical protein [Crocinitomicaceae bacterium]
MSFLKNLFGTSKEEASTVPSKNSTASASNVKEVKFGRYTDCNKNKRQLDAWNTAYNKFKEKAYLESFDALLEYIRDEHLDNVKLTRGTGTIDFEIIQGSKVVRGRATATEFRAECPIVQMDAPSIPVMRKLMAINYTLLYSKFALKDNTIVMKFSSHAIDAGPYKLYAALKEMSKKADQQDDLLTAEFTSLKSIDTDNIISLTEQEKEIKYNALVQMINDTKAEIAKHDPNYMSGGIAFILLNLSYKIDYLICPQGNLTDSLEKIQQMFFAKDNLSTVEKNRNIMAEFDKVAAWPKEKIMAGLYDVKCTFAIANPTAHKTVMDMMFDERNKVNWYRDNNYPQIVDAIYSYMISYAFFNYGMVYPVTDMLNLCMHVLNPEYYESFGASPKLVDANKALNATNIKAEINRMTSRAKAEYPHVFIDVNKLNFTSAANFIDSMILEIDRINLNKN